MLVANKAKAKNLISVVMILVLGLIVGFII
jgi:hypothetical protein